MNAKAKPEKVYAAWVNYRGAVEVESADVVRRRARTVEIERGSSAFRHRKVVPLDEAHTSELEALAALLARLEADRDDAQRILAARQGYISSCCSQIRRFDGSQP